MSRYVAFLRGVSPMNAKMAELKQAFESLGYSEVKTILSSGNIAFCADSESEDVLARHVEGAMTNQLGRTFFTIVRLSRFLQDLVKADPFCAFNLPDNVKRIVTFIGEPSDINVTLPIEKKEVRILSMYGRDLLSAYIPGTPNPTVLPLIEKLFGSRVTTRTWETVKKCAIA